MLFKSLVKAALVATALAQPVQHQHHQHEKKDVVTRTVVVTVGAGDSTATLAVADVSSATSVTLPTASASYVEQVPGSSAASGTYSGTSTASQSTASSSSSFSGSAKGITYSPYASDGSCKSASVVKSEIQALSDYSIIRIYGVDCDQVANVLAGFTDGQKLFAGIYYMDAISDGVETLATAVKAAGGWDLVYTVSIGNELVNSGEATTSQVKSYIEEGRTALTAAGYTGSVVSVDTFIAVIDNPALCEYSDYLAINAHAYFDGYIEAADAGSWVLLQIENVATTCASYSKSVLVVESGWPTKGSTYGVAVPSTANQEAALSSISDKCGDDVFFFNAYNDLWKADGTYGVEKYWGIYGDGN